MPETLPVQEYLEALETLQRSEGWRIYKAFMAAQEQSLIQGLATEKDANTIIRTAGAFAQLRLMQKWVEQQAAAFKKQLEDRQKKNTKE